MTVDESDEKTNLVSNSTEGLLSLIDNHRKKERSDFTSIDCSERSVSSVFTMESFLPREKHNNASNTKDSTDVHQKKKEGVQWKDDPTPNGNTKNDGVGEKHVEKEVKFAAVENKDSSHHTAACYHQHEDDRDYYPRPRSFSVYNSAKSLRVTVSNFTLNFIESLTGKGDEKEKKRQLRLSKFILVVNDPYDEDENVEGDEEEQVATPDHKDKGMFASLIDEVKGTESAVSFLWKFPENSIKDPNTYLQACFEVSAATLVLSWAITFIFNPTAINDNPLEDRLGYKNLCVGWDTFPANIVGVIGETICAHLVLRFVNLNDERMKLLDNKLSERVKRYGRLSSKAFALSSLLMPAIFAIPPTISVFYHTLPFLMLIVSSAAVLLGRFIMFQDELSQIKAVYICAFSLLSFVYPIVCICEFRYYDLYGEKSGWPAEITMTIDYSWFVLCALMPFMLPKDIVLITDYKLGYRPQNF
uniref:Uncharacterized protein n=1 Tax=Chaetoceros debilis TaxID=122233 RepID=A0A7S3Q3K4_9STRA